MALRGSFSSAFTRRNCSHDKVFHSEYQRTNRTKENKILRCFPHCCPEHVRRSYCGSSLHLQVDFHAQDAVASSSSSSSSSTFRQPSRNDDLLVFGRFRPRESRGFRVGDRISGAAILSSLQSEDNPTGEWIEAWLIASADRNAWLYEVNHSARWYYNWSSSAAKDKRLKEHVFEVYVLYQSSTTTTIASEAAGDKHETDSFQVAAVSCSPPFKLLSFRRAPAETRKRGHADANAEQLSLSEEDEDMGGAGGDQKGSQKGGGGADRSEGVDVRSNSSDGRDPLRWTEALRPPPDPPGPLAPPPQQPEPRCVYWEEAPPVHAHHLHRQHYQHPHHHHDQRQLEHQQYPYVQEDTKRFIDARHTSPSWRALPPPPSPLPLHHAGASQIPPPSFLPRISISNALPSLSFRASHADQSHASSFVSSSAVPAKRPRRDRALTPPLVRPFMTEGVSCSSIFGSLPWRYEHRDARSLQTRSPSPSLRRSPVPFHSSPAASRLRRTHLEDIADVLSALRKLSLVDAMAAGASLETTFRQYAMQRTAETTDSPHLSTQPTRPTHPTAHAVSDIDTDLLFSQLRLLQSSPHALVPLPPDLAVVAAHLALWLQCDLDLAQTRASLYQQAAALLLHKPALAEAHERFVRWLHKQIDGFLRHHGWSLDAFLSEWSHVQRASQRTRAVDDPTDRNAAAATTMAAVGTGVAFADFVAAVREQFITDQQTERLSTRQHRNAAERLKRLRGLDRSHLSSNTTNGIATSVLRDSRLGGVWRSELGRVRMNWLRHDHDHSHNAVSLDSLIWFWTQFSHVTVSLHATELSASSSSASVVMEVRSAFAAANSTGLRLVTDSRARWFRAFPNGESTSARYVGGQSFGDYRAAYDAASDTIECAMYSWPTSDCDRRTDAAYCWRWQLAPTSLTVNTTSHGAPELRVQLAVERGVVAVWPNSTALAIESLAHKCDRVQSWDRVVVAEWTMTI